MIPSAIASLGSSPSSRDPHAPLEGAGALADHLARGGCPGFVRTMPQDPDRLNILKHGKCPGVSVLSGCFATYLLREITRQIFILTKTPIVFNMIRKTRTLLINPATYQKMIRTGVRTRQDILTLTTCNDLK
jgi:hypothetical protein